MIKFCRVELYTELFYAIIPTLFPCFFLCFTPVYVTFLLTAGACLSEVCCLSQRSKKSVFIGFLSKCMQYGLALGWHLFKHQRGLTKPVLSIAFSMQTDHISNSVILINDHVSVCVHA